MSKKVLNEVCRLIPVINEGAGQSEPGVLATFKGVFATYNKRNKNNRLYSKKVWEDTLSRPEVQDALKGKRMYGELDHPEEYVDIKIDKTALCVTDLQMDEANESIIGEAKVLDTPAGRILNTLLRFGSVLGVSSRACGELDENNNVIPEEYDFVTFDVVTDPSNVDAIPTLVESTQRSESDVKKELYDALCEHVKTASKVELNIIRDLSSKLDEEMASDIIHKVEEQEKAESDVTISDILQKVDEVNGKLDLLIAMFTARFGDSSSEEEPEPKAEEAPVEVEESQRPVVRAKVRKKVVTEGTMRDTNILSVRRVNEDTDVEDGGNNTEKLITKARSK